MIRRERPGSPGLQPPGIRQSPAWTQPKGSGRHRREQVARNTAASGGKDEDSAMSEVVQEPRVQPMAMRMSLRMTSRAARGCLYGAALHEAWTRYRWARVLLRLNRGRRAAWHAKRGMHVLLALDGPESALRTALFNALRAVLSEALSRTRSMERGARNL